MPQTTVQIKDPYTNQFVPVVISGTAPTDEESTAIFAAFKDRAKRTPPAPVKNTPPVGISKLAQSGNLIAQGIQKSIQGPKAPQKPASRPQNAILGGIRQNEAQIAATKKANIADIAKRKRFWDDVSVQMTRRGTAEWARQIREGDPVEQFANPPGTPPGSEAPTGWMSAQQITRNQIRGLSSVGKTFAAGVPVAATAAVALLPAAAASMSTVLLEGAGAAAWAAIDPKNQLGNVALAVPGVGALKVGGAILKRVVDGWKAEGAQAFNKYLVEKGMAPVIAQNATKAMGAWLAHQQETNAWKGIAGKVGAGGGDFASTSLNPPSFRQTPAKAPASPVQTPTPPVAGGESTKPPATAPTGKEPVFNTVKLPKPLAEMSPSEVNQVETALGKKLKAAQEAEAAGKPVVGGSAAIESDLEALKAWRAPKPVAPVAEGVGGKTFRESLDARLAELEAKSKAKSAQAKKKGKQFGGTTIGKEEIEILAIRAVRAFMDTGGDLLEHIRTIVATTDKHFSAVLDRAKELMSDGGVDFLEGGSRRSFIDELSERLGHGSLPTPERETQAGWLAEAMAQGLDKRAHSIATDVLASSKRLPSPQEVQGMGARLSQIAKAFHSLRGTTDDAMLWQIGDLEKEFDDIYQALRKSGTATARSLAARAHSWVELYDPLTAASRYRAAATKAGDTPIEDVANHIKATAEEVQDLEAESSRIKDILDAIEQGEKPTVTEWLQKRAAKYAPTKQEYDVALKQLASSLATGIISIGGAGGAIDIGALKIVVRHHVAQGFTKAADITQAISRLLGKQVSEDAVKAAMRADQKELLDKAAREAIEKRINKIQETIDDLNAKAEAGDFSKKTVTAKPIPPQVAAKQAELKSARERFKSKKRVAELNAEKARLDAQIETGNYDQFWKKAKKEYPREYTDLRADVMGRRRYIDRQVELASKPIQGHIARLDASISALQVANLINRLSDLGGNEVNLIEKITLSQPAAWIERRLFGLAKTNPAMMGIRPQNVAYALRGFGPRVLKEVKALMLQGSAEHALKYGTRAEAYGALKYAQRAAGVTDIPAYDIAWRAAFNSVSKQFPGMDELLRVELADAFAEEVTYMGQNFLTELLGKAFSGPESGPVAKAVVNLVARFPRILSNVMGQTTDMYFGAGKAGWQWLVKSDKTKWSPTERRLLSNRIARNGLGAGMTAAGYLAAANGWVGAPDDNIWGETTWGRVARNMPGSFQAFLFGVSLHKYVHEPEKTNQEKAKRVLRSVADAMTNHPYFSGMEQISQIARNPESVAMMAGKLAYRNVVPSQVRELGKSDIPFISNFLDDVLRDRPTARDLIRGKGNDLGLSTLVWQMFESAGYRPILKKSKDEDDTQFRQRMMEARDAIEAEVTKYMKSPGFMQKWKSVPQSLRKELLQDAVRTLSGIQ